jgi:hypothetical protein
MPFVGVGRLIGMDICFFLHLTDRVVRMCECRVTKADIQDQVSKLPRQPSDWYRSSGFTEYTTRYRNDTGNHLYSWVWPNHDLG